MGSVKSAMFVGGSEELPRFGTFDKRWGTGPNKGRRPGAGLGAGEVRSLGKERLQPTTTSDSKGYRYR